MQTFDSRRFGSRLMAIALPALASLLVAYGLVSARLSKLELLAALAVAALALPVEASVIAILALADGVGSWFGLGTQRSMAAAALLALMLAGRTILAGRLGRAQRPLALLIVGLLGVSLLNTLTLGEPFTGKDLVLAGGPYVLLLLVLLSLPADRIPGLLLTIAVGAGAYSTLYVLSAITRPLLPFVVQTTPATFAGHSIHRIWAPGGLLPVYGVVWAAAQLGTGTRRRGLAAAVLILSAAATVATLSRSVLVGVALALVTMSFLFARRREGRLRAVVVTLSLVGVLAFTGGVLNPRSRTAYAEVRGGTGNFGARLDHVRAGIGVVRSHPLLGVGFAPGQYDLSDSGGFTVIARFGAVGSAAVLVLLVMSWRRARRLIRTSRPEVRALGATATGLIVFYAATAFTTDALISAGGLALLAVVLALVQTSEAESRS